MYQINLLILRGKKKADREERERREKEAREEQERKEKADREERERRDKEAREEQERKEKADREERERRAKEDREERVRSEERIIALVQSLMNNGNSAIIAASAQNNNSMVSNTGDGNTANSNGISAATASGCQSHLSENLDQEMGNNDGNQISGVISPSPTDTSQHVNITAPIDMDTFTNNKRVHSPTKQQHNNSKSPTTSPEKKKFHSSLTPEHTATPSPSNEDTISPQLNFTPPSSSAQYPLSTEMNITEDGAALPVPSPPVIESMKDILEQSPYRDAVISTLRRRSSRINKESHVPNGNNE